MNLLDEKRLHDALLAFAGRAEKSSDPEMKQAAVCLRADLRAARLRKTGVDK